MEASCHDQNQKGCHAIALVDVMKEPSVGVLMKEGAWTRFWLASYVKKGMPYLIFVFEVTYGGVQFYRNGWKLLMVISLLIIDNLSRQSVDLIVLFGFGLLGFEIFSPRAWDDCLAYWVVDEYFGIGLFGLLGRTLRNSLNLVFIF
ncbi:hypothetical protein HPP92_004147 [Vanilla planifolia]|uniref:Uncharacterized protein n=1 Tax=Vanilla planifolia TaxID=51239 RepID=A0A835SBQ5_VANPL|nr:hypothetical protein HPP92_004147 [Vanilla planifolia]